MNTPFQIFTQESWNRSTFLSISRLWLAVSPLSLPVQVCDMHSYWRRCRCGHCVQDVQTASLSGRPVSVRLNYWSPKKKGVKASHVLGQRCWESYQQLQPNFLCAKRKKKIRLHLNAVSPILTPERKEAEKRKVIKAVQSLISPSPSLLVCLGTALLSCWVGFAGMSVSF